MNEATAWTIIACVFIISCSSCEMYSVSNRTERHRLSIEEKKNCYLAGGDYLMSTGCVYPKKPTKVE